MVPFILINSLNVCSQQQLNVVSESERQHKLAFISTKRTDNLVIYDP